MHVRIVEAPTTLVWIDSEEAIIVRWADRATIERVRSGVPGRHRSTGHDRVDPTVRHGGGSGPEDAERVRRARLAAFVEDISDHLPPNGDVGRILEFASREAVLSEVIAHAVGYANAAHRSLLGTAEGHNRSWLARLPYAFLAQSLSARLAPTHRDRVATLLVEARG